MPITFNRDGTYTRTSHPHPSGTYKLHYHSLSTANSCYLDFADPPYIDPITGDYNYFNRPAWISPANIRNIEFHFHMQPDNEAHRIAYLGALGWMSSFKRDCPIWWFLDGYNNNNNNTVMTAPMPKVRIVLGHHGTGSLSSDYTQMLTLLLGLMETVTANGFEEVLISVLPQNADEHDPRRGRRRLPLPAQGEIDQLRRRFEAVMGEAEMVGMSGAGEEWTMRFCPREMRLRGGRKLTRAKALGKM